LGAGEHSSCKTSGRYQPNWILDVEPEEVSVTLEPAGKHMPVELVIEGDTPDIVKAKQ
jgi:hypothetical protein